MVSVCMHKSVKSWILTVQSYEGWCKYIFPLECYFWLGQFKVLVANNNASVGGPLSSNDNF